MASLAPHQARGDEAHRQGALGSLSFQGRDLSPHPKMDLMGTSTTQDIWRGQGHHFAQCPAPRKVPTGFNEIDGIPTVCWTLLCALPKRGYDEDSTEEDPVPIELMRQ